MRPDRSELEWIYESVHLPWVARLSSFQRVLAALVIGALVFATGGVLDFLVRRQYVPGTFLMLGGAAVALALGFLVYEVLTDIHERYDAMLDRVRIIAELNHHIRNALQVIAFYNVPERSARAVQDVNSAVIRIDSVLREILPPRPPSALARKSKHIEIE